jgi:hypothetical protein
MQKIKIMEDVWRTYNLGDEFRDLYVVLAIDGTKSKEEFINLV